jgi:hypothetical protein
MVFCTHETGIFGLISEGQLTVMIRQIESENVKLFETIFPLENVSCKSKFYGQIICKPEKSALFLQL